MGDFTGHRETQGTDGTARRSIGVSSDSSAGAAIRLKDYKIRGVVGEGGIGVVFRAWHLVSNRPVGLKILHDSCARQSDLVESYFAEAKATNRIHHPNIADVTDFGTAADGTVFVAVAELDGESLEDRLRRVHRLPLFDAVNIVRQAAHALGAAHELGIVHRDLKPANIFLCSRQGRRRIVRRSKETGMRFTVVPETTFDLVKLLDFGASRFIDFAPGAKMPAEVVCRAPCYLSPEQAQGRPTDLRCDIYALGAVFYQMVTGTVPVSGETVPEIIDALAKASVIPPSRRAQQAGTSLRVDSLILKCLHRNPSLRFASMAELCTALDDCVRDCAYLRDAGRLPGIQFSGIDLSQASFEARQDARPQDARPVSQGSTAELVTKAAEVAHPTLPLGGLLHRARASVAGASAPTVEPAPTSAGPQAAAQVERLVEDAAQARVPAKDAPERDAHGAHEKDAHESEAPEVVARALAQAESPMAAPAIVPTPALEKKRRSSAPWLIAIGGVLLVGLAIASWWESFGENPTGQPGGNVAPPASTPAPPARPTAMAPAATPNKPAFGAPAPSAPAPSAAAPVPAVAVVPAAPAVPATEPTRAAAEPARAPAVPAAAAQDEEHGTGEAKAASAESRGRHHKKTRGAAAVGSRGPLPAPAPTAEPAAPTAESPAPTAEPPAPAQATTKPEAEPETTTQSTPSEPEDSERAAGSSSSAADSMRGAQRMWRKGHYKAAIRKARAVLKAEPKTDQVMEAYKIMAASSCALGRVAAAREAASHLDKRALASIQAACKKDGVTLKPNQ